MIEILVWWVLCGLMGFYLAIKYLAEELKVGDFFTVLPVIIATGPLMVCMFIVSMIEEGVPNPVIWSKKKTKEIAR
jgi:hypothetical protein